MTEDEVWNGLIAHEHETFLSRGSNLAHLVHYTSFSALKGILETEELWFSSTSTTNDFEEVSRGRTLIERLSASGQPLFTVINSIREMQPDLWKSLNDRYFGRNHSDFFHTYISCWSECDFAERSHDNLTMWRGYAADGNGVAIVIGATKLILPDANPSDIVMCPVFYEDDLSFAARAERAFSSFRDALERLGPFAAEFGPLIASAFSELCFYLSITHKHPGFRAEREWRFTWSKDRDLTDTGLSKYLRPSLNGGDLIEKFCLPIKTDPQLGATKIDIRDLITSIMIGPCDNLVLKRCAVVNLLESKGFQHAESLVTFTEIPYRSARRP